MAPSFHKAIYILISVFEDTANVVFLLCQGFEGISDLGPVFGLIGAYTDKRIYRGGGRETGGADTNDRCVFQRNKNFVNYMVCTKIYRSYTTLHKRIRIYYRLWMVIAESRFSTVLRILFVAYS